MSNQRLAHIAIVVKDYDEAIDFYVNKLNFILIEDTKMSDEKRWVIINLGDDSSCSILLAKAVTHEQKSRIGNQTGGRVFLFLHTDDFDSDYNNIVKHNITIVNGPRQEEFGKVLVFEDLYGNKWDLIEPIEKPKSIS